MLCQQAAYKWLNCKRAKKDPANIVITSEIRQDQSMQWTPICASNSSNSPRIKRQSARTERGRWGT
ncbi:hypothetical protein M430DRAFT_175336 [Amorphotheca resinae ATCC 22711]|uniref:Uncharacterized protein n=1 Tax=Amorphotheca resinae ATCC 22711 TaxID=857342 RepID=A0A2T3ASQ8_AMORE|nr:hypothetical protein M430DRAFT_175336 [Amorphotheca resinae ATCC 22711]PSS10515.1 hypothetical protein M430DRAFT_175336 [Amorphotheca resinae ATCC 22711]